MMCQQSVLFCPRCFFNPYYSIFFWAVFMCGHCLVLNRDGSNNVLDNQATFAFVSVFLGTNYFKLIHFHE